MNDKTATSQVQVQNEKILQTCKQDNYNSGIDRYSSSTEYYNKQYFINIAARTAGSRTTQAAGGYYPF